MAKPKLGLTEALLFAAGIAAVIYVTGAYHETPQQDPFNQTFVKEFVLDNGQKCHVEDGSKVFCRDGQGNYHQVDVSFLKQGTPSAP